MTSGDVALKGLLDEKARSQVLVADVDVDADVEPKKEGAIEIKETHDEVLDAIERGDWERLRELSLRSGGFGKAREKAWYVPSDLPGHSRLELTPPKAVPFARE